MLRVYFQNIQEHVQAPVMSPKVSDEEVCSVVCLQYRPHITASRVCRNSHFLGHRLGGHCCFVLGFDVLFGCDFDILDWNKGNHYICMSVAPAACKLTPNYFIYSLVFKKNPIIYCIYIYTKSREGESTLCH